VAAGAKAKGRRRTAYGATLFESSSSCVVRLRTKGSEVSPCLCLVEMRLAIGADGAACALGMRLTPEPEDAPTQLAPDPLMYAIGRALQTGLDDDETSTTKKLPLRAPRPSTRSPKSAHPRAAAGSLIAASAKRLGASSATSFDIQRAFLEKRNGELANSPKSRKKRHPPSPRTTKAAGHAQGGAV